MSRERERGIASLKTIVILLVIGAAVYAGIYVVPVYYNNYLLEDKMREEARFAMETRKTPEELRAAIYKESQSLGLPVRSDDIRVDTGTQGILISAEYAVPIDLHFYQFTLRFTPNSGRP